MSRTRRNARSHEPEQTAARQSGPQQGGVGNQAAAGQQEGGATGWFRRAGSWMGDKVGQASETVGRWADQTKQVAQDAWDVATSTSVGMEDGAIYIETDLDELSDFMSPETRAALALDRATADNRVRLAYTRSTGELVATSDEIALAGVQTDTVQSATVTLRGVRAVFTNQGGKVPGLNDNFSLLGYKDAVDNLQAVVTIADAEATEVSFTGPDGPTTVASVKLAGLTGTVGAEGGMPFSDAGTTEVDFALEHAVLEGLSVEGHTVASAELSGLSGGMSGANESAFLAADAVSISGAHSGDQQVMGESTLSGLRVDVDNKGGGLLGVDDQADHAKARVAVEAANVSQLDTADFDAASLSARDLSGDWDTTTGTGRASASTLGVSGLDTSWVDATRLQADNLSLGGDLRGEDGRRDLDLKMQRLHGDGLTIQPTSSESNSPGMGGMPLDWSADIGSADLTNSRGAGATVDHSQLRQASLGGNIDGQRSNFSAEIGHTELTGFSHATMTADQLATTNTSISANADQTQLTADHVQGSNINTESFRAGELNAYGGSATLQGPGASATLDRARIRDATIAGRMDVEEAQLNSLTARRDGTEASVSAASGEVRGVSDRQSDARLTQAAFTDASLGVDKTGVKGKLGHAEVSQARGFGATLSSGSVDGLGLTHTENSSRITASQLGVNGLAHGDTALASGSLSGISAQRSGGVDQLAVDRASATGLSHGTTSVAQLSAAGLSGRRDASGLRGGVDSATAQQVQVGQTASVATANLTGLAASHTDQATSASLSSGTLTDVDFATNGARGSLDSVGVQGAAAHRNAQGQLTAGAESLQARGLDASGTISGNGASGGLDMARLVETSAAQVQHADISGRATMPGGDLGVGGLRAARNTQIQAGVSVRNGQIQDRGTHARASKPIDGPLWTSVNGAYVKDGRLRTDVKGWADKDITSMVNDGLGVSGRRLPSTAAIGAGVANQMRSSSSSTDLSRIVDTDSVSVDGTAQLGDGVIDAGPGQVDLGRAQQAGDNRVDVQARDGSLEANIQRFLADSASWSSRTTSASTGQMSVDGASLDASADHWGLQADALDVNDLRTSTR